jgi:hypothetical protein
MPDPTTNVTKVVPEARWSFFATFVVLLFLGSTIFADEWKIAYSPGIEATVPEIVKSLNELKKLRKWQCKTSFEVVDESISALSIPGRLGRDVHVGVVLSSEIENQNKTLFKTETRNKGSVLSTFIAVSTKPDPEGKRALEDLKENDNSPVIYPAYESFETVVKDVVIECAQKMSAKKIASERASIDEQPPPELKVILIKRVHFNDGIVGMELLEKLLGQSNDLHILPVVKTGDLDGLSNVQSCVKKRVSELWEEPLNYEVLTLDQQPKPFKHYEHFRSYAWVDDLFKSQLQANIQVVEKTEQVVLMLPGEKPVANNREKEFSRCLYDRFHNLQADFALLKEQSSHSESLNEASVEAGGRYEEFVKGFYLLSSGPFPKAGYANAFLYPEYATHYTKIGNFRRKTLVDRLGTEPRQALQPDQLEALDAAIKDYEKYIAFRKSATDAKSYDRRLLDTYFRFAQLRKIRFDHYLVESFETKEKPDRYLDEAIATLEELHEIVTIINSSTEQRHKKYRESYFFENLAEDVDDNLKTWKAQR